MNRRWLVVLMAALLSLGASSAFADDFDFSGGTEGGEGGEGGEDDGFDFSGGGDTGDTGDTGTTTAATQHEWVPGPAGKPAYAIVFDTLDPTEVEDMDKLIDALVEHMGEFPDLYAGNGAVLRDKLNEVDPDRSGCSFDPTCLSDLAKGFGMDKVIIGRLLTEGYQRPRMVIEMYDVNTASLANIVEYDAASRSKARAKELRPAAYKLLNRQMPADDSLALKDKKEDEGTPIATWQIVSSISCGVVGLGMVGGGIAFGLQASSLETELKDARADHSITQREAESKLADAKDKALIANIMYGVGGVVAAVGIILIVIRPGDEIAEDQEKRAGMDLFFEPSFGADGAGLVGGIRF